MNIVIDAGNSNFKVGIFDKASFQKKLTFTTPEDLRHFLQGTTCDHMLVSTVSIAADQILSWSVAAGNKIVLRYDISLPVTIDYKTPETLGVDRIAAACGARGLFPDQYVLVIDAGTCINYEFVDIHGTYRGGAISPGVKMRFDALHSLTAKLPLTNPVETANLTGDSTVSCLQSGVMNGILEEINGIIARYQGVYPGIRVILCGGDAHFFENHLKPSIFVTPDLVLMGLNSILLYNVQA